MQKKFLCVTRKELFYAAVMLHIRRLVNIVYEFPADTTKFEQELNEAKSTLRKKKLLRESAREGVTLDFALTVCAAFCAEPESCEVVNENNYYATIYHIANISMLMETSQYQYQDQDSEDELRAVWFLHKDKLDEYIKSRIESANQENINVNQEGDGDNGRA